MKHQFWNWRKYLKQNLDLPTSSKYRWKFLWNVEMDENKSDEESIDYNLPSSSTIYLASPVRFYHLEYNLLYSNISGRNDICHSARAPSVLTGLAPFRGQSSLWKLDWKLDKRVVEPCRSCIDWPQSPM